MHLFALPEIQLDFDSMLYKRHAPWQASRHLETEEGMPVTTFAREGIANCESDTLGHSVLAMQGTTSRQQITSAILLIWIDDAHLTWLRLCGHVCCQSEEEYTAAVK